MRTEWISVTKKSLKVIMERIKASITTKATLFQSNNRDEHNTLHTKLLKDSACTNKIEQSFFPMDDFTGGPICTDESNDLQTKQYSCDQNTEPNRSITTTPADSSCGFHNTLSVLESHLNKTKYPNLSQQQIEYLLLHRKDVAIYNNSYIDIPINNDNQRFVDDNFININSDSSTKNENPSSLFELELEAMDRLNSMCDKEITSENFVTSNSSADLPMSSEQIEENVPNEYIYHIARSRSGQFYLRVRRNSRSDQGTLHCNTITSVINHI